MAKTKTHIPLVDLLAQYKGIKKEIDAAISGVLNSARFIGGEEVEKFAIEYANIANTTYCVPCANGTDAIEIVLSALGIGRKDEVIIPAFSFAATLEAVVNSGATPVLCDVDKNRLTIDPKKAKKLVTKRTKAIMPVHLYGQMADMDPLTELCRKKGLFMIEDAAQAHKAEYNGFPAGSMGIAGTFSFFPGKNLGAYGDAGAITTSDESLYRRIRMIADHGRTTKYEHEIPGRNSRLDALQAAILRVKAQHLEKWIKARRNLAARYDAYFINHKKLSEQIRYPLRYRDGDSVYHLYVIRVDASVRDQLRGYLWENGIETGVHYPVALSKLKVTTTYLKLKSKCPVAEKASKEVISLPLYPELSHKQQDYICDRINQFYSKQNALRSSFSTKGNRNKS